VAAFSTDPKRWYDGSPYTRIALAGQDGRFTLTKLPVGDYWVFALDAFGALNGGEWQSADLLSALSKLATPITVPESQRLTTTLTLVRRSP
jgi:hypothetical protein